MKFEKTEYSLRVCACAEKRTEVRRHYEFAADSYVGLVRHRNEDSYLCAWDDCCVNLLTAVADGIGSTRNGDVAGSFSVRLLEQAWRNLVLPTQNPETAARKFLRDMFCDINRRLFEINQVTAHTEERDSLGTTLTAAIFMKDRIVAASAGDSPIFLVRNGRIRQLTFDHNLANELVRFGRISLAEASRLETGRRLTRFIGPKKYMVPECYTAGIQAGDRFLVCSDGLTLHVMPSEIGEVLTSERNISDAVRTLFRKTIQRGAMDNVTAILIRAV